MLSERAKFEAMFPMPPGCVHCGEGFAPTSYSAWKAHDYIEQWKGWRARAAIESAATAPLLARIAELEVDCDRLERYWNEAMATHKNIAELERQLAEARKDAMHEAALICDALPAPPSCNVLERNLWDVATVAAADAIRAAIKDQT